ncbi:glucose dehydrogenase [FAD, quinone]-like isoform X2 [Mytilus californianus]|uniref:glucose dehydrogenase [FAD, quinone]-like isoform X2 n=1 Tax=Mytilus californianus TaxID=6549 RepID=UPI0022479BCC|nr:glucose dehydrogenase [FAD, quinone]-like isoform X2 [Mytilus californianus]
MFLGHSLLNSVTIINVLQNVLPPGPKDPPGVFNRSLRRYYDYIIVGGGSAGSVLAARLTEDKTSVLLLEAGGSDLENEATVIPGASGNLLRTKQDWNYHSVPQKYSSFAMENKQIYLASGKMLGGCGSMNSMVVIRGSRHDYDEWAKQGCKGWSYKEVLPYFKKMETMKIPALSGSPYRGTKGKIVVTPKSSTTLEFFNRKAASEIGYRSVDCNGYSQIGYCPNQANIKNGERCSSTTCYLRPVMYRRNLQISLNSYVTKVLIRGKRAIGVQFVKGGRTYNVYARKEVIMSAGAFGSPHILLLSGVGPKMHLRKFKIPVHADLPVGNNLQNHPILAMPYSINTTLNINVKKLTDPETVLDYILHRKGYYTTPLLDGHMFDKLDKTSPSKYADSQDIFFPTAYERPSIVSSYSNYIDKVQHELLNRTTDSSFNVFLCLLHPKSKGYVRLATANPLRQPLLDPRFLANPHDIEMFLKMIRWTQQLEKTSSWRSLDVRLIRYDMEGHCGELKFNTDNYWRCIIRHFIISGCHPSSSCRMGSKRDPTAVVDPTLRVKGIKNLRVVDASVMRNVISGNTNSPTMMIAEKAAVMIKCGTKY